MFKLFIHGKTMVELKGKLQEAADAIKDESEQARDEANEIYNTIGTQIPAEARAHLADEVVAHANSYESEDGESYDQGTGQAAHGDVDSKGIPWSDTVHSTPAKLNKDGTWRTRRGVTDAAVKKYEAMVRSQPAQPVAQPAPPPVVAQPVVEEQSLFTAPPVQPVVQAAPVAVAPPTPPGAKPAHTVESFKTNFVPTISALIATKAIDQNYINTLNKHYGVEQIWEVTKDAAKFQGLFDMFVQYGMITKVG